MTIVWAIIVGASALASIAGWLHTVFSDSRRPKLLLYPGLAILFAAMTGYFGFQNHELRASESEASRIANTWPTHLDYSFDDTGKYRGIILQGFAFLEKYRDRFPDTYTISKQLVENSGTTRTVGRSGEFGPIADEVHSLHDAAEAMMTLVRGIAGRRSGS